MKKGFKPVRKLTVTELQQLADYMLRRASHRAERTEGWSRDRLIAYIESMKAPSRALVKKPRIKKARMPKNLGVGKWCREVLSAVIGHGQYGPVGHSYEKMVKMAQKKFPTSAVDERHLRWYATKARAEGVTIPSDRPRSSWLDQYEKPKKRRNK